MNSRPTTSDPFVRARNNTLVWGDTRNDAGEKRRVCVTEFPPDSTLDQLISFFGGKELLDGLSIVPKYPKYPLAFVQFKRPLDYRQALLKNQSDFRGWQIKIRPYSKEGPPSISGLYNKEVPSSIRHSVATHRSRHDSLVSHNRRSRSRSRSGSRSRSRHHRRESRNRSRSRGRSRSRSRSRRRILHNQTESRSPDRLRDRKTLYDVTNDGRASPKQDTK